MSDAALPGVTPDELADVVWRLSPAGYLPRLEPGWGVPPHIGIVSEAIRRAVTGEGPRRVIVTMPPRHGKSSLVSYATPTWFLNTFPERKVGLASYEADFASEWGHRVREAIREHQQWLRVRLDPSFSSRSAWYTTAGGGMFTAGVGGPFTGRGFDLLIVDDPIKNAQDAHSETVRERLWAWWQTTALTRLEPDGVAIVLMTRWHEEDLVGRLMRAELEGTGERWRVINLPALAEPSDEAPDLLRRHEEEPLWPTRYDGARLRQIRAAVGAYAWAALFQGRPAPAGGGIFKRKWLRFYDTLPASRDVHEWLQSWDLSFKGGGAGSFVVGQVWARVGADRYLVDQVRRRMDFVETIAAVRAMSERWPTARTKLIEDAANGPAVVSTLRRELVGLIPVKPEGSKEARAHSVVPEFESGNVLLPTSGSASWVDDFVAELLAFPSGAADDQVDACVQALRRFSEAANTVTMTQYRDLRLQGRR